MRRQRTGLRKKLRAIVILLIIAIGGSVAFALLANAGSHSGEFSPQFGFGTSGTYQFGTNSSEDNGWLMPSNTLLTTSFVTSQNSNHYVSGDLVVFPYEQVGMLYLGLYINGNLEANQTYDLTDSHAHPAVIDQSISSRPGANLAVFSSSLEGYSVYLPLQNLLPVGTKITISAFVTQPIWIQVINSSAVISSESTTGNPIPASLTSSDSLSTHAPFTPVVEVSTDES